MQTTDIISNTSYISSDAQSDKKINDLRSSIEQVEVEREQLREALRTQIRAYEQFVSIVSAKIEAKEKELRHFLVPRPIVSESDFDQQTSTSTAPIQSTVPAVRPVPTLIGGATKSTDGLLGPAYPTTSSSDTTTSSLLGPNRTQTDSTRKDARPVDTLVCSKVPIDHSVHVVFSRLRRMQKQCNALIASNQTDLQSFTFTQNSQNGKRIMTRLRVLEKENQELATAKRTGRTARLDTEITLRRRLVQDMKRAFSDMEFLIEEVEGETEVFGNSLLLLQQRLQLARATALQFATKLDSIVPGKSAQLFDQANWTPFDLPLSEQPQLDTTSGDNLPNGVDHSGSADSISERQSESPNPTPKSRPIIPIDGPQRTLNSEPHLASQQSSGDPVG